MVQVVSHYPTRIYFKCIWTKKLLFGARSSGKQSLSCQPVSHQGPVRLADCDEVGAEDSKRGLGELAKELGHGTAIEKVAVVGVHASNPRVNILTKNLRSLRRRAQRNH